MDSKDLTDTAKNIISKAPNWNFEGDCLILQWMEQISENLEARGKSTLDSLNQLSSNITRSQIALENTQNSLTALQYTQYVEMRCQDDEKEIDIIDEVEIKKPNQQEILKTFLQNNIKMLHNCHDKFNFVEESDDEDSNAMEADNCIYQPRNPYNERLLPHIYGTKMWKEQSHVGLCDDSVLDYSGDEKSEVYSISSSSESVGQESQESHNTANTSQWTSSTSLNNEVNNATKGIKIPTNISQTPSVSSSPLNPMNSVIQGNIPEIFTTPIPKPREFINETKPQQQNKLQIEQTNAEPTAQQPTGAIKKRTLNLFDDNDYKNLISEFVDKTQTKNEKPKTNLFDVNEDETFTKPIQAEKPTLQHQTTSSKANLFGSQDEDITVIKTGNDFFDKLEQPKIPQTAIKKIQISAKSLFDDDDDDDFLDFFSKKKTNLNPTLVTQDFSAKTLPTALFDGDDVVDRQVHTQANDNTQESNKQFVKPTISDSKNSSTTIKTSKPLFFDDDDNDDYFFAKSSTKTHLEKSFEKARTATFPVYLATEPPEDVEVPVQNKEMSKTVQTKNFNVDNEDDFLNIFGNQKPKEQNEIAETIQQATPKLDLFAKSDETQDFNQFMSSSAKETHKINEDLKTDLKPRADEQREKNEINSEVNTEKHKNFENRFESQKPKDQGQNETPAKQTTSKQNLFAQNSESQEPENLDFTSNNVTVNRQTTINDSIPAGQDLFSNNLKTAATAVLIADDSDNDFDSLFEPKVNKNIKARHEKVESSKDIQKDLSLNATEKVEGNKKMDYTKVTEIIFDESAKNETESNKTAGDSLVDKVSVPFVTAELNLPGFESKSADSSESSKQKDTFSFKAWLTEPTLDKSEELTKTTDPIKTNQIVEARNNKESVLKPAVPTKKLQLFEDDDENDFISTLKNQAPKAKPRVLETKEPQNTVLEKTENIISAQESEKQMDSTVNGESKIDTELKTQKPAANDNLLKKLATDELSKLRSDDETKGQEPNNFDKTIETDKIDKNSPPPELTIPNITKINEGNTSYVKNTEEIKSTVNIEKAPDTMLQTKTPVFDHFSPLFLDEPPDDDDFLQTLSASSSNIVNTQYSVDNDFYEPNLATSNQKANIDLKSDETNQTNTLYNICLFDELPPEDEQSSELATNNKSTQNHNQTKEETNILNNLFVADKFASIFDASDFEAENIFKRKESTEKTKIEVSQKSITEKNQTLESSKTKTPTKLKEAPKQIVSKLKLPKIDINVQALLPNAKAKPFSKKEKNENTEDFKETSSIQDDLQSVLEHQKTTETISTPDYSNDPNKAHLLPSLNKNRVRMHVKRRTSTRAGRQESYRQTLQAESESIANLGKNEEEQFAPEKTPIGDSLFKKVKIKTPTSSPLPTTTLKQTTSSKILPVSPPLIVPTELPKTTALKQSPPAFMQSPHIASSSERTIQKTESKLTCNNENAVDDEDDDFFSKLAQPNLPKAILSTISQKPNDDDELFNELPKTTTLPQSPPAFVEAPVIASRSETTKTVSKLPTHNNNADDDFFKKLSQPNLPKVTSSTISQKPTTTTATATKNATALKTSIKAEDSDDDLFSSSVAKKVISSTKTTATIAQKTKTLKSVNQPKASTTSKSKALFDSDSADEDNDNDLFRAASKPTKPTFQPATKSSKQSVTEAPKANITQKLQSQTKSLFSDSEDDDNDLFGSNAAKSKSAHVISKTHSIPKDPLGTQRSQQKNQQKVKVKSTKTADNPLADLLDE